MRKICGRYDRIKVCVSGGSRSMNTIEEKRIGQLTVNKIQYTDISSHFFESIGITFHECDY
jgi:hypothetical protein